MSDNASTTEDKPLSNLVEAEQRLDEAEEVTAKHRLRAFEDEHLGADVPRIDGRLELGHGSKFHQLDAKEKAEHAALERLVKAEDELVEATAALSRAQAAHAEATAAVERHQV